MFKQLLDFFQEGHFYVRGVRVDVAFIVFAIIYLTIAILYYMGVI